MVDSGGSDVRRRIRGTLGCPGDVPQALVAGECGGRLIAVGRLGAGRPRGEQRLTEVRVVFEHGELAFTRGSRGRHSSGRNDGSNPNGPSEARVAGDGYGPKPDALSNTQRVELTVRDRCSKEPERPGSATTIRRNGSEAARPEAEDRPGRPVAAIAPAPVACHRRCHWVIG